MATKIQIHVLVLIVCDGLEVYGQATQIREVSKCEGNEFSEVLCATNNYQLHLVNALYGDMGYWPIFCDEDSISQEDCRVNVTEYNREYYLQIEEACRGNSCHGLVAGKYSNTKCRRGLNWDTDYVTIVYKCVETEIPTEPSTTSETSTIDLSDSTSKANTNPGVGVLVGVPVAVVIIAAILVVIVLYILRQRQAPNKSTTQHENIGGGIANQNMYTNSKAHGTEFTESQDDVTYENQHNAGPLVYSLATGSVRLTNSTRDETETDMIVYDNDNYTPYPQTVNMEDITEIDGRNDNEGNDTILCDNTNYSSFADDENTQDVTIIEDNVNYAGYNSEPSKNNEAFHQNFNDEEDQTVLFDNQQYVSTEEAVPTERNREEGIIIENLNYEAWDQ